MYLSRANTTETHKSSNAIVCQSNQQCPRTSEPMPPAEVGQWVAPKEEDDNIRNIYHITQRDPTEATLYHKNPTEQLQLVGHNHRVLAETREVRVVRTWGPRNTILDYNPT